MSQAEASSGKRLGLNNSLRVRIITDRGQGFRRRPPRPNEPVKITTSDDSASCDPTSIAEQLELALVASGLGPDKYFLPHDRLTEILSFSRVRGLVRTLKCFSGHSDSDKDSIAMDIYYGSDNRPPCLKVLATLLCMDMHEDIMAHIGGGLNDDCFPLQSLGSTRPTIYCQNHGETHTIGDARRLRIRRDMLSIWSYRLSAPFIRGTAQVHSHYVLEEGDVLPVVSRSKVIGGVYKVEIPTSHCQFNVHRKSHSTSLYSLKKLISGEEGMIKTRDRFLHELASSLVSQDKSGGSNHLQRVLATFEVVGSFRNPTTWYFLAEGPSGNLNDFWKTNAFLVGSQSHLPWMARQFHGLCKALHLIHVNRSQNEGQMENRESKTLYGFHHDIHPFSILWFRSDDTSLDTLTLENPGDWQPLESGPGTATYLAPDDHFGQPNSSEKMNIFSLGCVFLEYVTWFFLGLKGIRTAGDERVQIDIYNIHSDTFFTFDRETTIEGEKMQAVIKKSVTDLVAHFQNLEDCSEYLYQLLDIILERMLQPYPSKRIGILQLTQEMDSLSRACGADPGFYCGPRSVARASPSPWDASSEHSGSTFSLDSISSVDSSSTSISSVYGDINPSIPAEILAGKLYGDTRLRMLYTQGVITYDAARFRRHHIRLLKILFRELQAATTDTMLQQAVRFLGKSNVRATATAELLNIVQESRHLEQSPPPPMDDPSCQREETSETPQIPQFAMFTPEKDKTQVEESESSEEDDDEAEETEEDDDEAEETEDSDPGDQEKVVQFVMNGPIFEKFRSNLYHLVYPPRSIQEALNIRNTLALERLLGRKWFMRVTEGEYSWLRELKGIGYKPNQLAELLMEDASDSPWIFFSPGTEPDLVLDLRRHTLGCVHQFSSPRSHQSASVNTHLTDHGSVIAKIQHLCGIAGIAPSTRKLDDWNGSVTFEEDNSVASASYDHPSLYRITARITNVLELLCAAMSIAQSEDLCCESFTILCYPVGAKSNQDWDSSSVESFRISFELVSRILQSIRQFSDNRMVKRLDVPGVHKVPTSIRMTLASFPGLSSQVLNRDADISTLLNLYSLSAQVLSLGFMSYIQNHVASLHPCFLDTPLQKVQLFGCQPTSPRSLFIEASFKNLTCIGNMLQKPVLVFRSSCPVRASASNSGALVPDQFDLVISTEDLIDTWGPGWLIKSSTFEESAFTVCIGGGFISPPNNNSTKYHWDHNAFPDEHNLFEPNLTRKIKIGASVTVNQNCTFDENTSRANHSAHLQPLGTYPSFWHLAERQAVLQVGGPYVITQLGHTYQRSLSKTLKEKQLERFLIHDEEILPFLKDRWAVQVSLCTHIARRVSLYEMVADLLPTFMASITSAEEVKKWNILRHKYGILNALQNGDFRPWLRQLDSELHDFVLKKIRFILGTLSDTGLDAKGNFLQVAWPHDDDITHCLKINLGSPESSWLRLVADSDDCAIFAYMSPKCLQTDNIQCRGGVGNSWCNSVILLETAVEICPPSTYSVSTTAASTDLRKNGIYHFKKMDDNILVKAEMPNDQATNGPVKLKLCTDIPPRIVRRLLTTQNRLQQTYPRVRERRGINGSGDRFVLLTSSKSH